MGWKNRTDPIVPRKLWETPNSNWDFQEGKPPPIQLWFELFFTHSRTQICSVSLSHTLYFETLPRASTDHGRQLTLTFLCKKLLSPPDRPSQVSICIFFWKLISLTELKFIWSIEVLLSPNSDYSLAHVTIPVTQLKFHQLFPTLVALETNQFNNHILCSTTLAVSSLAISSLAAARVPWEVNRCRHIGLSPKFLGL